MSESSDAPPPAGPELFHAAGAVLNGASWLTLLGMVALTLADFDVPGGDSVDWLFGVPVIFRLFGNTLYAYRGTLLAWVAVVLDLGLAGALVVGAHGDVKGRLLIGALVATNLVPALWCARGHRPSAVFGGVGALTALVAWVLIEGNTRNVLIPLGISIVLAWVAHAAIAVWALQTWRARNPPDGDAGFGIP